MYSRVVTDSYARATYNLPLHRPRVRTWHACAGWPRRETTCSPPRRHRPQAHTRPLVQPVRPSALPEPGPCVPSVGARGRWEACQPQGGRGGGTGRSGACLGCSRSPPACSLDATARHQPGTAATRSIRRTHCGCRAARQSNPLAWRLHGSSQAWERHRAHYRPPGGLGRCGRADQ